MTAITFVAMGTSLPDTFASKQSATSEPYADNSIGNVRAAPIRSTPCTPASRADGRARASSLSPAALTPLRLAPLFPAAGDGLQLGQRLPRPRGAPRQRAPPPHRSAAPSRAPPATTAHLPWPPATAQMPWAIAAIYWTHFQTPATVEQWKTRYRAGFDWYSESMPVGFAVPAGDLSFSVAVFAACAVTCLSCIILRRQCVGMELGGPPCSKYGLAFFFVLLWFTYIGVSSASSYGLLAGLL